MTGETAFIFLQSQVELPVQPVTAGVAPSITPRAAFSSGVVLGVYLRYLNSSGDDENKKIN